MTERIGGAAIRVDGIIHSVAPPMRHHHVIRYLARRGVGPEKLHDQGFVTSTGRFVNRIEGLTVAQAAGQIIVKTPPEYELFSEDMW